MSPALWWHLHKILCVTVMYCLTKYYVATEGMLHIVAKVYMINPLSPSQIHTP